MTDRPVPPEWIRFLLVQSGGVPRYLDRLVTGLADTTLLVWEVPEVRNAGRPWIMTDALPDGNGLTVG